jgi:hypothetical protein
MVTSKETMNKVIIDCDSNTSRRSLFRVVRCHDLIIANNAKQIWNDNRNDYYCSRRRRNRNGTRYAASNIITTTQINEGNCGMGLGMTVTL